METGTPTATSHKVTGHKPQGHRSHGPGLRVGARKSGKVVGPNGPVEAAQMPHGPPGESGDHGPKVVGDMCHGPPQSVDGPTRHARSVIPRDLFSGVGAGAAAKFAS